MASPSWRTDFNIRKLLFTILLIGIVLIVVLANWPWPKIAPKTAVAASSTAQATSPVRPQPDPDLDPHGAALYVEKLARQSGGDFDRLSEDDRIFLNSLTAGYGREMLRGTVRRLKAADLVHKRAAASKPVSNQ